MSDWKEWTLLIGVAFADVAPFVIIAYVILKAGAR